MNLFTRNSPYYHLLKYLLFLLKHLYVYQRFDPKFHNQGIQEYYRTAPPILALSTRRRRLLAAWPGTFTSADRMSVTHWRGSYAPAPTRTSSGGEKLFACSTNVTEISTLLQQPEPLLYFPFYSEYLAKRNVTVHMTSNTSLRTIRQCSKVVRSESGKDRDIELHSILDNYYNIF
jgi:hypothetical protein